MKIGNFWVVTKPNANSTLGDICWKANVTDLVKIANGGLNWREVVDAFDNEKEAKSLAKELLAKKKK